MKEVGKVIILGDLHLAKDGETTLGIDTAARFQAVIKQINTLHPTAQAVVFAGDISDDKSRSSYEVFSEIVASLDLPWIATPGNHDERRFFGGIQNPNSRTERFDDVVDCIVSGHRLSVIMLDTAVDDGDHGILTQEQLDWLACQKISDETLIVTHHPVQHLSIWTDCIKLKSEEALLQVLEISRARPTFLAGHVHMNSAGSWRGYPVATVSGNNFQVAPVLSDADREQGLLRTFHDGPPFYAIAVFGPTGIAIHFEQYTQDLDLFDKEWIARMMTTNSH